MIAICLTFHPKNHTHTHTELEALGDELAADADASYLDELTAPNAPTQEPGSALANAVSISDCV